MAGPLPLNRVPIVGSVDAKIHYVTTTIVFTCACRQSVLQIANMGGAVTCPRCQAEYRIEFLQVKGGVEGGQCDVRLGRTAPVPVPRV